MKTLNGPFAVTGATGVQGGALARLLLDRGLPVRALTRHPSSPAAQALRERGAEIAHADFDDRSSLEAALRGARAAFLMSTPFGTDVDTEIRQGVTAVDAAALVGVPHLVFSSVAHADRATGVPHFDSKHAIERHLSASGLDWTVLGPAKFLDNFTGGWAASQLRQGTLALPLSPDRPLAVICARDIAAMAALALTEPERLRGQRIDIAGQMLTPLEMAEAFTAAVGHPITFRQVPENIALSYGADLHAMFRYFDTVGLDVDVEALHGGFPDVGWHTMRQWLNTQEWSAARNAVSSVSRP
jgi:uncharacterized protein YbjT (DUF2867 family)